MDNAQNSGLLGLAVVVGASLVAVVFAFLRMAGVIHGRGRNSRGRPPPPVIP